MRNRTSIGLGVFAAALIFMGQAAGLRAEPLPRTAPSPQPAAGSSFASTPLVSTPFAAAGSDPSQATPGSGAVTTPGAEPLEAAEQQPLGAHQELISRRYKRFEETLLKIAESLKKSDPERANLLRRALGKSNETRVSDQMRLIGDLLARKQFGDAFDREEQLVGDMKVLLELMLSEDRARELAAEKARLERYLKDLNRLIAEQKDVHAGTERGDAVPGLQGRQEKLTDKARQLGGSIAADDEAKQSKARKDTKPEQDKPQSPEREPSESPDSQSPKESGKPDDAKPGEPNDKSESPAPGESSPKPNSGDSNSKPKSSSPSPPSPPSPSQPNPSDSAPSESENESQPAEQSQPPQSATPGRENLEAARKEMERAIDQLKKQSRDGASERQQAALQELRKAKEKLEEILRQLREEERERRLAALEARFQRMLAQQLVINDGTVKLDKTPVDQRTPRHQARSRELAQQEEEVLLEANKALVLLREEGTTVALPIAVDQLREDMRLVAGRLERADVGDITQAIERDIVAALEEIIEDFQKEMEKNSERKQQSGQSPQGEPPLIDQLAELKLLRTLQLAVNRRTRRLGREVEGEQAHDPDIVEQLRKLSARQAVIQQGTYDLATGKNQ